MLAMDSLGSQNYQKKIENTFKRVSLQKKSHEHLEKLKFHEGKKKNHCMIYKKYFYLKKKEKMYRFVLIISI